MGRHIQLARRLSITDLEQWYRTAYEPRLAPGSITLIYSTGALAIRGDEGDRVDSMLASYSAGPTHLS